MPFYVYENWTAQDKAVIHKGECGYCNHGKGCHENPSRDKHGRWHGKNKPFNTYQEAKSFAESLGRNVVKPHRCILAKNRA